MFDPTKLCRGTGEVLQSQQYREYAITLQRELDRICQDSHHRQIHDASFDLHINGVVSDNPVIAYGVSVLEAYFIAVDLWVGSRRVEDWRVADMIHQQNKWSKDCKGRQIGPYANVSSPTGYRGSVHDIFDQLQLRRELSASTSIR
jgi:hypothetical protein